MLPRELIKKVRHIEIRTKRLVNDMLAGQLASGQEVCVLLPQHLAMAFGLTVGAAAVAAALAMASIAVASDVIEARPGAGEVRGTITITGQVDQGASDNKGMRLSVALVEYSDGPIDDPETEEEEEFLRPTTERYEHESSAYFSTSRLWDDGILDPLDTRSALALGIAMSLNAPIPDQKYGVFRM